MVTRHQDDWGVIAHLDEQVNPEISFLDGLLVGRQVTVDYEDVCVGADCVLDKPFKTLRRVGEVAVLFQVNIASLRDSQGHRRTPLRSGGPIQSSVNGECRSERSRNLGIRAVKPYPRPPWSECRIL